VKEGKTRYGNFGVIGRIIGTMAWPAWILTFIILLVSGIAEGGVANVLLGIMETIIPSFQNIRRTRAAPKAQNGQGEMHAKAHHCQYP